MSKSMTPAHTSTAPTSIIKLCAVLCLPPISPPGKDRLSVMSVLTDFMPVRYLYNQQARQLLDTVKLADKARVAIDALL